MCEIKKPFLFAESEEKSTAGDTSDKIKAASEHNIDLTNKTEPQPLIRKSTINDFARHSTQCYCCRITRGIKSDKSKRSLVPVTFRDNKCLKNV